MQADAPDNTIPPGEAEPIDAEFEPAKPEKRGGGAKALARVAGFVLALALAAGAGGMAGWYAAGLNRPDSGAQAGDEITRLESQIAGLEARLNAAEDRPLTEMVPTEALRTFDSDIRALEQRLETVEARAAAERVTGLDASRVEALLDERDAALRDELDEVRALARSAAAGGGAPDFDPAPLQDALDGMQTRLAALEESLNTELSALEQRQNDASSQLSNEMRETMDAREQALLDRIAALEARTEQAAANTHGETAALERSAARILAFTALRETARTSESFEAERAALARLWPEAAGLSALQPHARRGVPSTDDLAESFPAEAIMTASGETRRFLGLFEIRPANSSPDSALALVGQAESRLTRDDLAGAVEAAARLDGAPADAAAGWLAQARARLDIETALTTLRNDLSQDAATPGQEHTMIRLILTVALCVITAILAVWLTLNPGTASFEFLGWQAETSFALFMGVLIVAAFLLTVLWWLIAKMWGAPDAWRKLRRRRRRDQGVDALERALIAAAAGEGELAVRQAARADALLERPALSRLLAARAAEAAGNLLAARGHYEALLEDPRTRMVAHRGLSVLAETQGETGNVITHAGKAFAEARTARWAFDSLFNAQIAAARWDEALETLSEGEKRRHIAPDSAARRRAVVLTVKARQMRQSDGEKAAELAEKAAHASPGFAPAAVLAGDLLPSRRRHRKAADILETAWRLHPHPAIARAYGDLRKSDTAAKRAARLRALAEFNPDHRESRLLLTGIALQQGNMDAARSAITPLLAENPLSARICTLAARLSRLEGDEDAAQRYLARAAHAPGEADWSDIDGNGEAFNFAEADWQRLVYAWGDEERLIHPRHERFEMIAEAIPDRILLEAPKRAAKETTAPEAGTDSGSVIIAPAPLPDRETRKREETPSAGPRFAPDDPGVGDDD